MYGHPAAGYLRRLLQLGDVRGPVVVADVHIGTYRHSYALAALLPEATVYSIDCWDEEGRSDELAIRDVRDLEPPPTSDPRIIPLRAPDRALPLDDRSCDVVVFGFGTHEIPTGGPREALFAEAERVLKPGGKALLFEHGLDLHNALIFGPVIHHVTGRRDWEAILGRHFDDVRHARTSHAVDLYSNTWRWPVERLDEYMLRFPAALLRTIPSGKRQSAATSTRRTYGPTSAMSAFGEPRCPACDRDGSEAVVAEVGPNPRTAHHTH